MSHGGTVADNMNNGKNFLEGLEKWKGKGEFTLDSLKQVLSVLEDPQDSVRTIHVGGTNGKGSVSTFIASILGASGLKVGLNISPHLVELNERIVIDGRSVSDEFFNYYGARVERAVRESGVKLSFHEAITAIAFLGFREEGVEFSVIEVGLGGRLDASNVIKTPEVSVIVSIGLDHQEVLGEGELNIAREKAGIIKKDSRAVIGDLSPAANEVIKSYATNLQVEVHEFGKHYKYEVVKDKGGVFYDLRRSDVLPYSVSLPGDHQLHNAAVAIMATKLVGVSDIDIKTGLSQAFWPGRLERFEMGEKTLLLDCAHNPAGINALVTFLKVNSHQDVTLCFGALQSKNWREMVHNLIPFSSDWRIAEPISAAAVSDFEIAGELSGLGIKSKSYGTEYGRLLNDLRQLNTKPLILLTGSIYFVGAFRSLLDRGEHPLWIKKMH